MYNFDKRDLAISVIAEINTKANAFARKNSMSAATEIICGDDNFKIINKVKFGYRKSTTNEYVPNSYLNNFGWKNTYYQSAICVIAIPKILWSKLQKWEKVMVTA